MFRVAILSVLLLGIAATGAAAGQSSARFTVGITIGGPQKQVKAAATGATAIYTWGAATISVRKAGYSVRQRGERTDTLYWFVAERNGASFRVAVSIASGSIVKIIPA